MNFRRGKGRTAAVYLWISLLFLLSGLLLYLAFSLPPDPPRHSYPVMAETSDPAGLTLFARDHKNNPRR